jgi:hypothetical protein
MFNERGWKNKNCRVTFVTAYSERSASKGSSPAA